MREMIGSIKEEKKYTIEELISLEKGALDRNSKLFKTD
jgi:hypothetical protein